MSRIRIVGGTITKTTVGDHNIYSDGNIVYSSGKAITETSDVGITYGEPKDAPIPKKIEATDFDITFELDKHEKTLVPFGIVDFKNKEENQFFKFKLKVTGEGINQWQLDIKNEDSVIYTCYSATNELSEVLIIGKSKKIDKKTDEKKNIEAKSASFWPAGEYVICWDGFNNNEIYDSTIFNGKKLQAKITAIKNGKQKIATADFSANYSQVQWTDVKIDKKKKRIDVTLRVNLTDGGAIGLTKKTFNVEEEKSGETFSTDGPDPFKNIKSVTISNSPPKDILTSIGKPALTTRTKTFEDLKKIAINGLFFYWGRNLNRGKNIVLGGVAFETYVNAFNTNKNTMDDIPLIYNTNGAWSRSGNTGGSYKDNNLDDEIMGLLPEGLVQRISYNAGYIYHDNWKDYYKSHPVHVNKGWEYISDFIEEKEFEFTCAHEIGHEILQAYGGTVFSWQHKGSSYYLPQNTKPVGKESFVEEYIYVDYMEETSGENTPIGEVDIMKYYNDNIKAKGRTIAAEKDVLGLIWLTKMTIKS